MQGLLVEGRDASSRCLQFNFDEDPTFIPPPIYETDYDFEEYSGEELQVCFPFILVIKIMVRYSIDEMIEWSAFQTSLKLLTLVYYFMLI